MTNTTDTENLINATIICADAGVPSGCCDADGAIDFAVNIVIDETMNTKTCGCRRAGLLIDHTTGAVTRCDECALFATDDDAIAAVDALVLVLGEVYDRLPSDATVADAHDALAGIARGFIKATTTRR